MKLLPRFRRTRATRSNEPRAAFHRRRPLLEALEDRRLLALSSFASFSIDGDYVASGVSLRSSTSGTTTVSAIPAGSTVERAYLYTAFLGNGEDPSLKNISVNGVPFTGTNIGTAQDTCWGFSNSFAYRTDVTSVVSGNGTYSITDAASGSSILRQGASLVVVYSNPGLPSREILLLEGNDVIIGSPGRTNAFSGFSAAGPVTAKTTFIVGDGQSAGNAGSFSGSLGTSNFGNHFNGSDGSYWDTDTFDVSGLIASSDSSASVAISSGSDCLMWVAQVMSVTSAPPNSPPTAFADVFEINEDTSLSTSAVDGVLNNDHDPDGDSLTAGPVISGPSNGALSLASDGSFVYTPNLNFHGQDSFIYEASDGNGGTDRAVVEISVAAINDLPVASEAQLTTFEDREVNVDLRTLVSDLETATADLTFTVLDPENGSVRLLADGWDAVFEPAADFFGTASFQYTVTDSGDGTAGPATATGTITIDVTPVDDAPVLAGSGSTVTYVENAAAVAVDPNISLNDVDTLSIDGASVVINSGFQPTQDSLTFTAPAGSGISGEYDAARGVLTLSGTASTADYQAALRSVAYANNSDAPDPAPRAIHFSISPAGLFNPATGHFYEFISAPLVRWDDARDAAEMRDLFGLQGYLATITSAEENAFAAAKLEGQGWIGSSDHIPETGDIEGEWYWVTGPEAGNKFWTGGLRGSAVAGWYENWDGGEPNNTHGGSEHWGHMIFNEAAGPRGTWNDLRIGGDPLGSAHQVYGYVVEYGGMPDDPVLSLTASATVNVLPVNDAPVAVAGPDVTVDEGALVLFDGSASHDVDGDSLAYHWDFGDGATASGIAPTHAYGDNGTYIAKLTVTDSAGLWHSDELTITVDNVVPEIASLSVEPVINEHGVATLSGTFFDPGLLDTHTVTVHWGDGSQETLQLGGAERSFVLSHRYLDDAPTGTPQDAYDVEVLLSDDDKFRLDFDDFGDSTGLTLSGDAVSMSNGGGGQLLQLTPSDFWRAGSVFSTAQIDASLGFSSQFTFRITDPAGSNDPTGENGADGLTFTLQTQTNSPNSLGGGLGYAGIAPSVAVEFDTWQNPRDPSTNHVGINVNGSTVSVATVDVPGMRFDNGTLYYVWIDYNGTELEVRLNDTNERPASPLIAHRIDIPAILGQAQAFTGFTAATGGARGRHLIESWRFTDTFVDQDSARTAVVVRNVRPVVVLEPVSAIAENGMATLSGSIMDPGTEDTFTVTVDWGDPLSPNNIETYTFAASATGSQDFTLAHRYLDDNPTGTSVDAYDVKVTVQDDDSSSGLMSFDSGITKIAPPDSLLQGNASTTSDSQIFLIPEQQDVTLTSPLTVNAVPTGTPTYNLANDPSPVAVPAGTKVNSFILHSDRSAFGINSASVTFETPIVGLIWGTNQLIASDTVVGNPGTTYPNFSTGLGGRRMISNGEGTDLVSVSADGRTLTAVVQAVGFQFLDQLRVLTAADGAAATAVVQVENVAPMITGFQTSAPFCSGTAESQPVTATLAFTDPGTLDTHEVVIDWGDGQSETIALTGGERTVAPSHVYATGGVFNVTVSVEDDDTGIALGSSTVVVGGVGVVGDTLYVVGSDAADHVTINQTGNGTIKVHAGFLASPDAPRNIPAAGVEQIYVILCGGDDHATIAGNVSLPAIIDGGDGSDHLNAGNGGAVLLGGDGDDKLIGGSGYDLLIGGFGADRLVGGPGEDVMIAGRSSYESDSATHGVADDQALLGFLDDWDATDDLADRQSALAALAGSLTADADTDQLTGASGADWFFSDAEDVITGLADNGN